MNDRILLWIEERTVRLGGEPPRGWLPHGSPLPPPEPVRSAEIDIEVIRLADHGGYLLQWRPSDSSRHPGPPFESDAWFGSLTDALDHASEQLGVDCREWRRRKE